MKKFVSFIKKNKKKVGLFTALILCAVVYTAAGGIFSDKTVNEDIPLHDGDVLVDSINVHEENTDNDGEKADESSLVTSDDVTELKNTDSYFQEMRATLDMDRNRLLSMLTESEAAASEKGEKKELTAEKMKLLEYMKQEKTIETLIKNKNLPETFVVISDTGVNVTVNTEELNQNMVTKICEIVMRQTDRAASDIVVQDIS